MNIALENLAQSIEQFLLLLSQKERFVIQRRFNLDQKNKATLEEIGQHFSVTRERIRQIEKNALNKLRRNLENTPLKHVSEAAYKILEEAGGIMKEDLMLAKLINLQSGFPPEALQLILSIDKRFERIPNTVNFHPYLRFLQYEEKSLSQIAHVSFDVVKKNKEVGDVSKVFDAVLQQLPLAKMLDLKSFTSFLEVDKKMKVVDDVFVGLMEWRHINPKTLRDKIFFTLRKEKKPMHFVDISNKILERRFDRKKINLQAVHNELIRNPDFVLVGRGIYGLKEWGYVAGTVAEVIEKILKDKGDSMSQEDIVQEVLKQRHVKPITVILSLKNKSQFVRVGRKQYSLKGMSA